MIAVCLPEQREVIRNFWKEAQELTLIFNKISSSARK